MEDFLTAYNSKTLGNQELDTIVRPYVCCPTLLSLAERQELKYKYQYLEETIEALAIFYRLSPGKTAEWIEKNSITRRTLETAEDMAAFEVYVDQLHKSIQIRLIGLAALNSAKAWQELANAEDNLLASLKQAALSVSQQAKPDPKTISSLAQTHDKMISRHELIQKGMEKASDVVGALQEQMGWDIEVTHVDFKPKVKLSKDEIESTEDQA